MSTFRAETYREEVRRLLHLAPIMKDAKSKGVLLGLAVEFHKMAQSAEAEEDADAVEEQATASSSSGSWLSH